MNQPPKYVKIELTDNEVYTDMNRIILDMEKIRRESIIQKNILEPQKDEYMHLTHRLASGIKATADDKRTGKMLMVAKSMDDDETLLLYDPSRIKTDKRLREFTQNLEDILISITADNFSSTKERYHVLQAIKYLCGSTDDKTEQKRIYDTILPIQGDSRFKDDSLFKRMFALILGETYDMEKIDDFTLKVKSDITLDSIDSLIEEIGDKGYRSLRVDIPAEEWDMLSERYGTAKIKRKFTRKKTDMLEIELDSNNQEDAPIVEMTECFAEFRKSTAPTLAGYLATTSDDPSTIVKYFSDPKNFETLTLAVESQRWIPLKKSDVEEKLGKAKIRARIISGEYKSTPIGSVGYLDEKQPDIKTEETYNIHFHRLNGKNLFKPKSFEDIDINDVALNYENKEMDLEFTKKESVDNDSVAFIHTRKIEGYSKHSILYYAKEEGNLNEYLLTTIMRDENDLTDLFKKTVTGRLTQILSGTEDIKFKAQTVIKEMEPKYMHLRRFCNDELMNDYEGD